MLRKCISDANYIKIINNYKIVLNIDYDVASSCKVLFKK
jgi:hypothetical protein